MRGCTAGVLCVHGLFADGVTGPVNPAYGT